MKIMKNKDTKKKIIIILLVVISLFICGGAVACYLYSNRTNAYSGMLQHTYLSAYEKIAAGENINVLVVGDSIGQGTGATNARGWATMLPEWIEQEYDIDCNLTNISMGGNTTYAGIIRTKTLDDGIDYDMVIICFGENDQEETISSEYEALIRTILYKYANCSIISILESSQREYTNKIQTIIDIDEYYDIPIVDTIEAFNNSGYEYDELVNAPDDYTHPNDLGHEIYLNTIKNVIEEQIDSISVHDANSSDYDSILYYDKKDMQKISSTKYKLTLEEPITADIGLFRNYCAGDNGIKIYADSNLVVEENNVWNYTAKQGHVYKITDEPVHIEKELIIEFSSSELAKDFYGLVFSNIE